MKYLRRFLCWYFGHRYMDIMVWCSGDSITRTLYGYFPCRRHGCSAYQVRAKPLRENITETVFQDWIE